MRAPLFLAIVLSLGPWGCPGSPSEAETKPNDTPAEPATPDGTDSGGSVSTSEGKQPPPAQAGGLQRLSVDVSTSQIGFAVSRATIGHLGKFGRFSATLELDGETPKSLQIVVETESVEADRKGLTIHLKSADFFEVAKYPQATFTTSSISPDPEAGPNAYLVKGTMELHGVRGELEFPATIELEPSKALGRATLEISAKRFGINYAGMEAELADDEVALEIELAFPRAAG